MSRDSWSRARPSLARCSTCPQCNWRSRCSPWSATSSSTRTTTSTPTRRTSGARPTTRSLEDAIDAAKEQQNDAYTDIVWTQNAEIVLVGVDGKHYTGQIEDEDIQDFVDEVSHASSDPDSKWEKKEVRVTWHPDDEPEFMNVPDSITYGELAEQWGVTPDQFEVRVVMIRDGHNSSLGYTTPLSAYTGKYDKWELTGHYISEFSHESRSRARLP